MNKTVISNYAKLNLSLFYVPLFLLILIVLFLYKQDALSIEGYIRVQKPWFFSINSALGQYPNLLYNLTQFGDALIFLSFITIFIVYAAEIWESLISASLVSALLSCLLKGIFKVPRPAAVFDKDSFVIIGKALYGHTSLPSGHSITIFTVLTILLFGFMPKKLGYKTIWCSSIVMIGLILVFTRVGVGAHYPLDVIIGGITGYISGLLGIFINQKYKIWAWINNKKCYPIFILLFIICILIILVCKISKESLIIFYLSLISLITSLYIITNIYVKEYFKK